MCFWDAEFGGMCINSLISPHCWWQTDKEAGSRRAEMLYEGQAIKRTLHMYSRTKYAHRTKLVMDIFWFGWVPKNKTASVLNYVFRNYLWLLKWSTGSARTTSTKSFHLQEGFGGVHASALSNSEGDRGVTYWWQALDIRMSCLAAQRGNPTEQRHMLHFHFVGHMWISRVDQIWHTGSLVFQHLLRQSLRHNSSTQWEFQKGRKCKNIAKQLQWVSISPCPSVGKPQT